MNHFRYLILGAGPTGLGAAYRLKELGESSFLVLEQAGYPGGLATSFVDAEGFTWDVGGHIQFSHYRYFDDLMQKALGNDGWLNHRRESWAWMEERFVPYPVQNNIRYLPKTILWECLDGIIDANLKQGGDPNNFREWLLSRFGAGLARVFLFPYNLKVWAYPPEELSHQWVGERVAVADLRRITRNVVFEEDDLSWGPNNTFRFPLRGGTGAIWKKVAGMIGDEHLRLNSCVESIDSLRRTVRCADGRQYAYEHLISTIPLDTCARFLGPAANGLMDAAGTLKHSASNIVGLGIKGQTPDHLRTKCWMYFPEANCPFYRATVFSNYSPHNVPDSRHFWSLMTETSESPLKPVQHDRLLEDTIRGCINTRLIRDRSEIVSTWIFRAEYGYPTPSLDRDRALQVLLPALAKSGIHSRGRFGAWKYEVANQDHSLMQGVELVNWLALGVPETTAHFPGVANSGWGLR